MADGSAGASMRSTRKPWRWRCRKWPACRMPRPIGAAPTPIEPVGRAFSEAVVGPLLRRAITDGADDRDGCQR